jgi:hypothetical protein
MKNVGLVAVAAIVGGLTGAWFFGLFAQQNGAGKTGPAMMISSDGPSTSSKASTALEEMQAFEAMHSKSK